MSSFQTNPVGLGGVTALCEALAVNTTLVQLW
jgi:hypothetical protein